MRNLRMGERPIITNQPEKGFCPEVTMTDKSKWFSRRHPTAEAHIAAQHRKEAEEQEYWERVAARIAERAKRTPAQQIAVLDKRLGKNKGARKERARLATLMEKGGKRTRNK